MILRRGKIRYDEFEVLIKDGASLDLNTCPTKLFRWLNDWSWLNLIQDSLGIKYLEISVLNFELIWEESNCKTLLLGLLSSGADPTLAKKKNIDLFIVSMGQGQEILARNYLEQTITTGGWLLLQNAHLGLDYLEELHETLMTMDPSFRVWLTTEIHPQFPIQILQSSIKFTNEPPSGVRAGLKHTYGLIIQDKLEYIETNALASHVICNFLLLKSFNFIS